MFLQHYSVSHLTSLYLDVYLLCKRNCGRSLKSAIHTRPCAVFHQLLIIDKAQGVEAIVILPSKMFARLCINGRTNIWFMSFSILNCYNKHLCCVVGCEKKSTSFFFNIITTNMKRVNSREDNKFSLHHRKTGARLYKFTFFCSLPCQR